VGGRRKLSRNVLGLSVWKQGRANQRDLRKGDLMEQRLNCKSGGKISKGWMKKKPVLQLWKEEKGWDKRKEEGKSAEEEKGCIPELRPCRASSRRDGKVRRGEKSLGLVT